LIFISEIVLIVLAGSREKFGFYTKRKGCHSFGIAAFMEIDMLC